MNGALQALAVQPAPCLGQRGEELVARAQALLRAALPDRALDALVGRLSGVR